MNKSLLLMSTILAATQLASCQTATANPNNPVGKCYGIAGPFEGDCGGKNPKTGESWSCAGQNPTADLGWKKMTKEECEAETKHPTATQKKFVANK